MKSLTYRSFLLLSPRRESLPFSSLWLPSPSHSFSSSSSTKLFEEDGRNVKVAVWWDFENCSIPTGVNVFRVAHGITTALRSNGIRGPVTITAFGDVSQLSKTSQDALISTGVCLNHVPCGGKNSSDRFFMADLVYWVQQNPPPAHFFLISGDKDFAKIIHRLRMSNYNILLASRDAAPGVLCSAATIMWPWSCLVKGENVAVKHFNHPPDGLYGSWYGRDKAALDDPFIDLAQASNSQSEESQKLTSETKPCSVLTSNSQSEESRKLTSVTKPHSVPTSNSQCEETRKLTSGTKSYPVPISNSQSEESRKLTSGTKPHSVPTSNSQSEESGKLTSETKPRSVPKAFVDATRQILYSYPQGMNMLELLHELKRNNATIDRDYFGYKKFSHLLSSMPSVLKLIPNASVEGQLLVVGTQRKIVNSSRSVIKPVQDVDVNAGEKDHTSKQNKKPLSVNPTPSSKLDTASTICNITVDQKETISSSGKPTSIHTQEQGTVDGGISKRIKQILLGFQHGKAELFSSSKGNDKQTNLYIHSPEERKHIDAKRGFLQRIWKAWNGPIAGQPAGMLSHEDSGEAKSICKTTEKPKFQDKVANLNNSFSNEPSTSSSC